jgi:hypothetical protein
MKKLLLGLMVILLLPSQSCKKTKLTGDYSGLIGNWSWIGGWSDNGNTNYKLELLEKGKYKLFNGNDKIDYGRLLEKNNKLTFKSERLFHKGYFTEDYQILLFKNDTLLIGSDHINDFPSSTYVKR